MKRRKRRGVGKIHENLKIKSLWYGWVGVCTLENGKKVLVKGALPDSIVDVKIVKKKRDYLTAHIVKVHEVDKKRLDGEVKCPHYLFSYAKKAEVPVHKNWCGWCKRQAISYAKQLELKQQIVKECFAPLEKQIGKIEISDMLWSPKQFGYRNKIEFSFGKYLMRERDEEGNALDTFSTAEHRQAWFHKQGEFSKVVDVDQCYLVSAPMHEAYETIKSDLKESWLPVHDAKTHLWLLRHLVIREWVHTNHLLVNLVIASNWFQDHPKHQTIWNWLLKKWKQDEHFQSLITTFVLTNNNGLADVVRGVDITTEILWWEGKIYEELHYVSGNEPDDRKETETVKVRFGVSPFSFFQTNTLGAQVLFSTAAKMIWEVKWNVIDLYCGWGSIWQSLLVLWKGKRVKWIEIVEEAIRDAQYNAKINHINERCDYYAGKAEKLVKEWIIWNDFLVWWDVVIVDPPREWMHKDVVQFLIDLRRSSVFKLCYISCNPTTMARDIWLLVEWWYKMWEVQSVDMFPHTHHIEVIAMLH